MNKTASYLKIALESAVQAGDSIMKVYGKKSFKKQLKADRSPVTEADHVAHKVISDILEQSSIPVLSEEGKELPWSERRHWDEFWLVDPLDGTKEFIKRTGEFTVNIALIRGKRPVLGVLYAPFLDIMYFSEVETGAFRMGSFRQLFLKNPAMEEVLQCSERLPVMCRKDGNCRVVASRSHINSETKSFIKGFLNLIL